MWDYYSLLENRILNNNINCLRLKPQNQQFVPKFYAGQYLYIESSNGKIRPYSIASSPLIRDSLELHIYHKHNQLLLNELLVTYPPAGNIVKINMPFGNAYCEENITYPIILIAWGYGFPPIKSMLDYVLQVNQSIPVYLYWIISDIADLYMNDYLILLEQTNPQFSYKSILNSKEPGNNWQKGAKGRTYDIIIRNHNDLSQYLVYAYGSPGMVLETFYILEQHGVNKNNMRSDALEILKI